MMARLKDSGTRVEFSTGAIRDGQTGKGRFDLIPYYSVERLAKHFENGANKFSERNWEKGIPTHRYGDSALRHLMRHIDGQRDEDHLAAAAWNVLALMETERLIGLGHLPDELSTLPEPEPEPDKLELLPDSDMV